ncbi:MAG: PKD domain-containing protein [Candidatus Gracilibacteria bacterium]|nr:PKD domain-containing protein [Candidatus Gracilibacteria bacterium]
MKNKYYIIIFIVSIILFQRVFGNFSIKEVLPNTDDDTVEEYVGIKYDGQGNNSLSGYTLSDLSGKIYTFGDDFFTNGEIKKYYRPTTKILLNDTNETLYLKDNFGVLVDTFSYTTTENGVVYTKDEEIIVDDSNPVEEIIDTETNSGTIIDEEIPLIDETTGTGVIDEITSTGNIIEETENPISDEDTGTGIIVEEINIDENLENTGSVIEDELIENTGSTIEDEITSSGSLDENNINSSVETEQITKNLFIKNTFQSPTYLNEKDIELRNNLVYNCDRTKDDCRINLDLRSTFTGEIKESDFNCSINFGLSGITGEENKCNPNTIIFPVGSYEIKIKIINKLDVNYFGELNFRIINDGKLIQTQTQTVTNYVSTSSASSIIDTQKLVLNEPIIKVQSGLDDKNICDKKECSINFDSENIPKNVTCEWDFGSGSYNSGNEKKCNPNTVYFGPGIQNISLKICDVNYEDNCKKSNFSFENIYKKTKLEAIISLQGKITKNKVLEGKKIICYDVDTCSINLDGGNSKGEDISFFWDFGDGDFSESKNPLSKVFKKGSYIIILEITDEDGDLSEDFLEVEVRGKGSSIQNLEEDNIDLGGEKSLSSVKEQELHSLKIDLQGKLGENKILNADKLTCIKTCSINLDGSKSIGNFKSYFWDFGNGETYIGNNPGYIKYEKFGSYIVLFSAEDSDGNIYEKQFFINFIEKLNKFETASTKKVEISLNNEDLNSEEIPETYLENDNSLVNEENKSSKNKFIIGFFTLIFSIGAYILMLRYKII